MVRRCITQRVSRHSVSRAGEALDGGPMAAASAAVAGAAAETAGEEEAEAATARGVEAAA